jgi:hypothetical protein
LVDTKSHVSKNSKVTISRLLGGVISELVLIQLNLDFEIDRSWMNLERLLNDIHVPTRAKYYLHSNSYLCWALLRDVSICVLKFFKNDLLPTLIASLTHKYWHAYIHSRICVHRQYIHNSPISIIMVLAMLVCITPLQNMCPPLVYWSHLKRSFWRSDFLLKYHQNT